MRMTSCRRRCKADRAALWSLPPPALRERRHRGLARRLVAVRRRTIFVMSERQGPHPRRSDRRGVHLHDAADHDAVGEKS